MRAHSRDHGKRFRAAQLHGTGSCMADRHHRSQLTSAVPHRKFDIRRNSDWMPWTGNATCTRTSPAWEIRSAALTQVPPNL